MKLQRNILCFFSCFLFGVAQAKNVDFKLEAVPLPKAVGMIYDEVLEKPYMLDPKLAADTRLISFHTKEDQDFNQFITRYFENMNIKTYEKNGVVYLAHIEPKPPLSNTVLFIILFIVIQNILRSFYKERGKSRQVVISSFIMEQRKILQELNQF